MSNLTNWIKPTVALALAGAFCTPAGAVDWSQAGGKTIPLFYTGQASWEWMLTQTDHSGAKDIRQGAPCAKCHREDQTKIGKAIVSGERLEPRPPKGMPGSIQAKIQAAHDGENLYIRIEWPAVGETVDQPPMDPKHPVKVSMMLNDGTLTEAKLGACWGACHDDLRRMASDTGNLDLTKYILASRTKVTRSGGGTNIKDEAKLKSLIDEGKFFEYWQVRVDNQGNASTIDGYILERRHVNETPVVDGKLGREGDEWIAVVSRPLKAAGELHKPIVPGKTYTVGFALHTGYSDGRYHHVSLEQTLKLNSGEADLIAKKVP